MSKTEPKSLSQLLQRPGSRLHELAETARRKLALTEHIRTGLPADLGATVLHCSIDDTGVLDVRAAGPEWAARLRFENERLLALSRELHPETTSVRVRVAHPDG
jgi:hypothetical protein